jgi:hypothetical protein
MSAAVVNSRRARRAPETVGGCSGCGSEWDGLSIVGRHGRLPGGEQVVERVVEGAGSGLQEPMGPFLRPLHLLLHKPPPRATLMIPSGLAPAPERRHRSALASGVLIRRRRET